MTSGARRRPSVRSVAPVLTAVAFLVGAPSVSWAAPQVNAGWIPGVCALLGADPAKACFELSGHADVMFGRSSARDLGFGPSLEVGTVAFDDVRLRLGPQLQLPAGDLSVVLTPSGYWRFAADTGGGIAGRAFVGFRSYNYGGEYVVAFGVVGGGDYGLGELRERNLMIGLHLDGMWSAIPFLALASWLSGP